MIYFDNAATTRNKPKEVYDAFLDYLQSVGTSPGRGSYDLAIQASRMLYQSRKTVTSFFGLQKKANVVFTKNSTEAINLFTKGFLHLGDHVLLSPYEHNAVLRPIHSLKLQGLIDYSVVSESAITDPETALLSYIRPNTRIAFITLASNLTGQIIFSPRISKVMHNCGIKVFVDASQGGGKGIVNMLQDDIDYLAFTGHKDLLGLPGVGGLCSKEELDIPPLIQGGTGIYGDLYTNPSIFPDAYEAGTINMPAIWALKAAIDYLNQNLSTICVRESYLIDKLLCGITEIPGITVYKPECARVPTISFNIAGMPSSDVVSALDHYGICVRGGIHCAILAHNTLGTIKTGAVRASINYQNTEEEIETFLQTVRKLAPCS